MVSLTADPSSSSSSGMASEVSSLMGQSTSQASGDSSRHSHKAGLSGVHWGDTLVHTYDREGSINESLWDSNIAFGPEIHDIDVDEVIEKYEAQQMTRKTSTPPEDKFRCGVFNSSQRPRILSVNIMKTCDIIPHTNSFPLTRSLSQCSSSTCSSDEGARVMCQRLVRIQRQCRNQTLKETRKPSSTTCLQNVASSAEANSYFKSVPGHILARIFETISSPADLCRSAGVCKRWYSVAWDPTLWTCLRLDMCATKPGISIDVAIQTVTKILSYPTYPVCLCIQRVVLANCTTLTDRGVTTIARLCPELHHLDVRNCTNITNIGLFELVSRCANLEILLASGCSQVSCLSLVPEAMRRSASLLSPPGGRPGMLALRLLDLSGCPRVDSSGLGIIANHCSELSAVYLRRCPLVGDRGVAWLARSCPQLREISLNECREVTDTGIVSLAEALGKQLRYLSLCKCSHVTDTGILALANHCPRLRYVNLRGCNRISDNSVERLAEIASSSLQSLDIGGCDVSDDSLDALARHCSQLRCLSLRGCDAVTDKGLLALYQPESLLTESLRMIAVEGCSVSKQACYQVRLKWGDCLVDYAPSNIVEV